jgi:hypothetical protein
VNFAGVWPSYSRTIPESQRRDEARAHAGFVVYDARRMRVVFQPGRRGFACVWIAAALLCAAHVSAQVAVDPDANNGAVTAPQTQPEPARDETPAAPAATPADDAASEAPSPLSPSAAVDASDKKLQSELASVRYEQEHSSTLLPWVVTATGAALLMTGLIAGLHAVLSCGDASCKSPWWPGWVVVAGATTGIAGVIWLRLDYRDMAELQSRRYQLERDLEHSRINAAPLPASGPRAALQFRAVF